MQSAGLAAVEAARADGRWDRAYASQSKSKMPDDFQDALKGRPVALAFFETISGTNRFAMIHPVTTAVKPETRARRIATFVDMLERGEVLYPALCTWM